MTRAGSDEELARSRNKSCRKKSGWRGTVGIGSAGKELAATSGFVIFSENAFVFSAIFSFQ